jgi:formimidoylglutamate deiminase
LLDAARSAARDLHKDTKVGIAPHSLRATNPSDLAQVVTLAGGAPIHMHIAEQPKEVADISAWLGGCPVEWLLANAPVNPDWCLIHATHMTAAETAALARSGAVAGLCPITEANLGDGAFNGPGWLAAGGRFGIGSDSNVRISLTEELRTLEYSQRLRDLGRNIMVSGAGSVGAALYTGAARGGAQAGGRNAGQIAVGKLADLMAIDLAHPSLCALGRDQVLDGLVFASPDTIVTDLWSAGRHQVRQGRHIHRDQIIAGWRKAVTGLLDAL